MILEDKKLSYRKGRKQVGLLPILVLKTPILREEIENDRSLYAS